MSSHRRQRATPPCSRATCNTTPPPPAAGTRTSIASTLTLSGGGAGCRLGGAAGAAARFPARGLRRAPPIATRHSRSCNFLSSITPLRRRDAVLCRRWCWGPRRPPTPCCTPALDRCRMHYRCRGEPPCRGNPRTRRRMPPSSQTWWTPMSSQMWGRLPARTPIAKKRERKETHGCHFTRCDGKLRGGARSSTKSTAMSTTRLEVRRVGGSCWCS